jgi:hypothetical protein
VSSEALHDLYEAIAFLAEPAVGSHGNIVEEDRPPRHYPGAKVVKSTTRDPFLIEIDEEGRDPASATVGKASAGKNDGRIGLD